MKTLIAVVNCQDRQNTWANAIRNTWKKLVPKEKADVFFFVGRGPEADLPEDTVLLDCDDSYMGLPDKVREIIRWAYEREYDFVLKCDDDTVLNPKLLLESGYWNYDYVGRANRRPTKSVPFWVPMGFNYWVSRNAMQYLLDAPLPTEGNDDEKWVAKNLYEHGILLQDDQHYKLQYGELTMRPVEVVKQIWRPLKTQINEKFIDGTFSWCIFYEGNSGSQISTDVKIKGFHMVFANYVNVVKH